MALYTAAIASESFPGDDRTARRVEWNNPAAVFEEVFADLPGIVTVLPTENYHYWERLDGTLRIRGNLRLASGRRERGELHFAYGLYNGDSDLPLAVHSRIFKVADGVVVRCPDPLRCHVAFGGRSVEFRLHAIAQLPPAGAGDPGETFVQRTFDDSGLPFFLMLQREERHFFWVLNEEEPVSEDWEFPAPDVARGKRTGFVFWIDRKHSNRKVLAAVDRKRVLRNDHFDGPFDQLADNYAAQTGIREAIEWVRPELAGRIDLYGYLSGSTAPSRVAIAPYALTDSPDEAIAIVTAATASGRPLQFIASRGAEAGLSDGRTRETVPRFIRSSTP